MRLKDRLFDLKIKYLIFEFELETKIKKKLHCNRGHHNIYADYLNISRQNPGKRKLTILNVKFFRCLTCGELFFLTPEDKDKYLKYQNKNNFKYFSKKLEKYQKKWSESSPLIPTKFKIKKLK